MQHTILSWGINNTYIFLEVWGRAKGKKEKEKVSMEKKDRESRGYYWKGYYLKRFVSMIYFCNAIWIVILSLLLNLSLPNNKVSNEIGWKLPKERNRDCLSFWYFVQTKMKCLASSVLLPQLQAAESTRFTLKRSDLSSLQRLRSLVERILLFLSPTQRWIGTFGIL